LQAFGAKEVKLLRVFLLVSFTVFFVYIKTAFAGSYCFNKAGNLYGINPKLLYAVAKVESGFNPQAIDYDKNGSYDFGVMQINSSWYKVIKPYWNYLANPCYNVEVGAWILKNCYKEFHKTVNALECYNSGKPYGDIKYVKKVYLAFKKEGE
jgi:soluble lytic murein transglycosylase-like protein